MNTTIRLNDFSFFNSRDVKEDIIKLKAVMSQGFVLEIELSKSTSLNEDLVILTDAFNSNKDYSFVIGGKTVQTSYGTTEKRLFAYIRRVSEDNE